MKKECSTLRAIGYIAVAIVIPAAYYFMLLCAAALLG